MTETVIPPIVKEVVVGVEPARAFEAFTADVKTWWPVGTHSVAGPEGLDLVLDAGGFVETLPDGSPCTWGSVVEWDPPHRLAMTWHPGQDPDPHTMVEVTFAAVPAGTLVRLTHSGWENLGLPADAGAERLGGYVEGWEVVLGEYVTEVGRIGAA